MTFSLDNYVDVPTRLKQALARWPELRVHEDQPVIREIGNKLYIEVRTTVHRDPDDKLPAIAYCWEPWPGTTPYTRDSEQMNASTSALGRALGFMLAFDKMASREEVRNRQPAEAKDGSQLEQPFDDDSVTSITRASKPQLGMIRALQRAAGLTDDQLKERAAKVIGQPVPSVTMLERSHASKLIDDLKTDNK